MMLHDLLGSVSLPSGISIRMDLGFLDTLPDFLLPPPVRTESGISLADNLLKVWHLFSLGCDVSVCILETKNLVSILVSSSRKWLTEAGHQLGLSQGDLVSLVHLP